MQCCTFSAAWSLTRAGPGTSQVFSLNASPEINAASARRQLQNYLSSLSSFRGRALAGPLAMPPISRSLPASDEVTPHPCLPLHALLVHEGAVPMACRCRTVGMTWC